MLHCVGVGNDGEIKREREGEGEGRKRTKKTRGVSRKRERGVLFAKRKALPFKSVWGKVREAKCE